VHTVSPSVLKSVKCDGFVKTLQARRASPKE
jgi:hypothetical protein